MEQLGQKLKEARKRKGLSVAEVADKLGISERAYNYYEQGRSEPKMNNLVKLCELLDIKIEDLYDKTDSNEQNVPVETAGDKIRKKKAFEPHEDEGLIFVPIAAQAGYALHFTDPKFFDDLERVNIPGTPYRGDRFRYFEVEGISMNPTMEEGMHVIGQKIEQEYWQQIQQYHIYVIVTDSQILIKRLALLDKETFVMISDNEDLYPQQILPIKDIKELWLVKRMLDWRMPPPKRFEITVTKEL
jgi:transcriptional regulator with XRE-family HTH domain